MYHDCSFYRALTQPWLHLSILCTYLSLPRNQVVLSLETKLKDPVAGCHLNHSQTSLLVIGRLNVSYCLQFNIFGRFVSLPIALKCEQLQRCQYQIASFLKQTSYLRQVPKYLLFLYIHP